MSHSLPLAMEAMGGCRKYPLARASVIPDILHVGKGDDLLRFVKIYIIVRNSTY
jgi:hypothetical protein